MFLCDSSDLGQQQTDLRESGGYAQILKNSEKIKKNRANPLNQILSRFH
jgi:hypothetical protein